MSHTLVFVAQLLMGIVSILLGVLVLVIPGMLQVLVAAYFFAIGLLAIVMSFGTLAVKKAAA